MHAVGNCVVATKQRTRTEVELYSNTIVKLTGQNLHWLIPLAKKLSKKTIPLNPKEFAIQDNTTDSEIFLYVQEQAVGIIKIDCYAPRKVNNKKISAVEKYEMPFFSVTIRFLLGKIDCINYEGDPIKKDMVWEEMKDRVIPIILYMQHCKEHAVIQKKKTTVKQPKKKSIKIDQIIYTLKPVKNEIPDEFEFLNQKFKVIKPKFEEDTKELSKRGLCASMIKMQDIIWLQNWANEIRYASRMWGYQSFGVYDKSIEKCEKYRLSAVRVYSQDNSFMQLQIEKVANTVYQISYFEEDSEECQMILFVNVEKDPVNYGLVYAAGDGEFSETIIENAKRLATFFSDVIIYLRLYSWEDSLKSDGSYYELTITELPKQFQS